MLNFSKEEEMELVCWTYKYHKHGLYKSVFTFSNVFYFHIFISDDIRNLLVCFATSLVFFFFFIFFLT